MEKTPAGEKMRRILLIIFIIAGFKARGQTSGKVEIIADPMLLSELDQPDFAPDTVVTQGYRIQIFFGNERQEATEALEKFKTIFPELSDEGYLLYQSPNYKVRVGNFSHEEDAKPLLRRLEKEFLTVFLVKDKVEIIYRY